MEMNKALTEYMDWKKQGLGVADLPEHLKKELLQFKYFDSQACKIIDTDKEKKTLTFRISDETVDRYKEIMKAKGCQVENFLNAPIILWAHNRMQELPPIGNAEWIKIKRKEIISKAHFAPTEFAQSVYQLYIQKFMHGVSVGYIVLAWTDVTDDDTTSAKRIIDKWDLLEYSPVPIAGNPNAFALAYKSGDITIPDLAWKHFEIFKEQKESENEFCKEYFCKSLPLEQKDGEILYTVHSDKSETEPETKEEPTEETPESEKDFEDEDGKPFENEHSCRLEDPKKYNKFRRQKCGQKHDGKCIDVIFGILAAKKSDIQALRYNKEIWTASSARAHCKTREGSFEPAKKSESGYLIRLCDLIELVGEEKANAIIEEKEFLEQVLKEQSKDPNEIDLENIEVNDGKEIDLAEIEAPKTGLESSDKDVLDLTEKDIEDLKNDLKKEFSKEVADGVVGELRKKYLGIVD